MTKIVQNVSELKKPVTDLPKNKDEQDVIAAAFIHFT